ncbi:hypothetical protein [Rossellomorea marisflavi]|jgi:hypothetical protein|uniref:hypothetical protein n=1 Tax=Rossellomorea marisflavi TaxID=189381 RepID=UPI0034593E84
MEKGMNCRNDHEYENDLYSKHMIELDFIIVNDQVYEFCCIAHHSSPVMAVEVFLENGTLLKDSVRNKGLAVDANRFRLRRKLQEQARSIYKKHGVLPADKHLNEKKTAMYQKVLREIEWRKKS